MSSASLGMIIELLVAGLLIMTISYCVILNSRLKSLRADEHILKATIGELLAATEVAERAIIGLKTTTREAEQALGQKLRDAQTMRNELQHMTGGRSQQQITEQRAAPIAAQQIQHQPAQSQPQQLLHAPQPQQVANALRGLDQALNTPAQTTAQLSSTQKPAAHDFRVFTRSTFSSRG